MKRLEEFNPYDLSDIADIDKFIELWHQKKIKDAIKAMQTARPPVTSLEETGLQKEAGQDQEV